MRTARRGSRSSPCPAARAADVIRGGVRAHVGLDPRADLGRQAIDRVRRGHEQGAQFGTAPGEIGHDLRDVQLADQLAGRGVDPHAARTRDPDIAALVAFHPVRAAVLRRRPDFACEQTLPRQRAVGRDIERADQFLRAVVDVEQLLVRDRQRPFGCSNRSRSTTSCRSPPSGGTR